MLSVRGPRGCPMTLAETSRPATAGFPTFTPSASVKSSTRPSFTSEPGSAASLSTRMRSRRVTWYCFPPLTTTADGELSGLGTARDCTKRLAHEDRGGDDDGKHDTGERGDRSRVQAPRDLRAAPPQEHRDADNNGRHREAQATEEKQPAGVLGRGREEQRREHSAVRKPGEDARSFEPRLGALV